MGLLPDKLKVRLSGRRLPVPRARSRLPYGSSGPAQGGRGAPRQRDSQEGRQTAPQLLSQKPQGVSSAVIGVMPVMLIRHPPSLAAIAPKTLDDSLRPMVLLRAGSSRRSLPIRSEQRSSYRRRGRLPKFRKFMAVSASHIYWRLAVTSCLFVLARAVKRVA